MSTRKMSPQDMILRDQDYYVYMQRAVELQRRSAGEFSTAFAQAKKAAARAKPELAVEWCHYAAKAAWLSNCGFFYCHEMEQFLGEIGQKYLNRGRNPFPATPNPIRFLHIITIAFAKGGHTRVVSRWIENCAQVAPGQQHSILVSRQGDEPLPAWLGGAARRTGGDLIQLPPSRSWLQTAGEIRSKSLEFDVIVLHVHPNDPLPNLAFFDQPRPLIFYNHADTVFTLGTDVAHVIADLRPAGQVLSSRLRSQRPRKCLIPIPIIDDKSQLHAKAEARKKLGLPLGVPIALTLGEPFKFRPAIGYSFPAVVQSICQSHSDVIVVAIGISRLEPFPDLERLTGGRFRPVGRVLDPETLELYYSAADVYLESFPCGSFTSALDAARHALPVQRLNISYLPILWNDDLALDSVLTRVSNPPEYEAGVLEWLQWPEEKRSELGARLRAAVLREHCGASWKSKWLDPAINALSAPGQDPVQFERPDCQGERDRYAGLAGVLWEHPVNMFAAAIILILRDVDWRIRISGVWRSFKPLFRRSAHGGRARQRWLIFMELLGSLLLSPWVDAGQKMLGSLRKGR